ncbi:MAG: hypothetical protein ACLGP3_07715 [Acidobacteriota bacterium]
MNVPNLLVGLNSVILIFLAVNVFKPFFGSYSAKKGENLATKEDIAQLTKTAEGIKAEISDKVWDRQKQWEMRRDIVFESMRKTGKLESCLIDLLSFHESKVSDNQEFKEAQKRFLVCAEEFENTMYITDLLVGEKLCGLLHDCVNKIRRIALQIIDGKMPTSLIFEASKQVLNEVKVVKLAARKELEIKNHDAIVAKN